MNRTQGSSNFSGVTSCGTSGARTCNIQRGQQDQNRVNMIYHDIPYTQLGKEIPNLERRYIFQTIIVGIYRSFWV